jgi:uncharacterized membrane protein YkvA (DUF1232 family)
LKFLAQLKQKVKTLKSQVMVLVLAYRDKRTPFLAKLLIGITIGYLFSPVDLIPDFIPVLGLLDDLIIVPALILLSIKLIPVNVLDKARQIARANPRQLKKTNWFFAIIIVVIWLLALYYAFTAFYLKLR